MLPAGLTAYGGAIADEGLSQSYTAGGRGTEALALEWVVRNLRGGGTAMMIVPDGLMNQPAILDYVMRQCLVRGGNFLASADILLDSEKDLHFDTGKEASAG